jgi:hypothetical protein
MFAACMSLCKGHFKQRIRALTVTAVLMLAAVAIVLVAIGFGLSLLYVWLQQLYGTMPALGIIAGGCAALGLILFLIAFFRPASRRRPIYSGAGGSGSVIASGEQALDEAIGAVQHGSRETMLAALSLAVVAGVILGRKL